MVKIEKGKKSSEDSLKKQNDDLQKYHDDVLRKPKTGGLRDKIVEKLEKSKFKGGQQTVTGVLPATKVVINPKNNLFEDFVDPHRATQTGSVRRVITDPNNLVKSRFHKPNFGTSQSSNEIDWLAPDANYGANPKYDTNVGGYSAGTAPLPNDILPGQTASHTYSVKHANNYKNLGGTSNIAVKKSSNISFSALKKIAKAAIQKTTPANTIEPGTDDNENK